MRIGLVCVALGVLVGACAPTGPPSFDGDGALALVGEQVQLGPRFPGSEGHAAIQSWITRSLGTMGWKTSAQSFEYRGEMLTNLSARLPGGAGRYVILGAHYDTRRLADRDGQNPGAPVPGANDGASGVAVLLEVARLLASRPVGCDVELVFFDGEDNGSLDGWEWAVGARHYAAALEREPAAVVVVDMVGDRDLVVPMEPTSSSDLVQEIWDAAALAGSTAFVDSMGPAILDDHTPFLERGWRAIDIIDIQYPYWHTTADTTDKVSAESLRQVGDALLTWLDTSCVE